MKNSMGSDINYIEKYQKYLNLDPRTFDQIQDGWRGYEKDSSKEFILSDFQNKTKFYDLIELLKFYLQNYKFDLSNLVHKNFHDLIKFHIGQIYAEVLDYEKALMYFEDLKDKGYENIGINYLDFTIAFLKGDDKIMDEITAKMTEGETNYQVVQRMNKFRKLSYLEAYSGMILVDMKEYISNHNI